MSFASGFYSVIIEADDGNAQINSTPNKFYIIKNYSSKITKIIKSITTNQYLINITLNNKNNYNNSFKIIDFVDEELNFGSFNQPYNWLNLTSGFYSGTILGWNIISPPLKISKINYSITNNNPNYNILNEFILGLE